MKLIVALLAALAQPADDGIADPSLLTVAERSDFRATARHEDVVALLDRLAASSPLARRVSMGRSGEGRDIPVIVIADPPVGSPDEAARAVRDGRLVALAIGNIHAGEVDGKEALPILARELLTTRDHPLLRHLIVALAPIYNPDGNERAKPLAELAEAKSRLMKPIDEIFEKSLKNKLETLPTRAQREAERKRSAE